MKYFKKITGEKVYLSPLNLDDAEIYAKWLNDYDITRFLGNFYMQFTVEAEREVLERISKEHNYAIVRLEDDVLLGSIGLKNINNVYRTAEAGIFIGETSQCSKGYGTEAMKLLVNYGFEYLNLKNIMLTLHSDNERAYKSYCKAGFKEFGRRTKCIYVDGKYIDSIYMEILNPNG